MRFKIDKTTASALTPTGCLRAVINIGNPILARRVGSSIDGVAGVSVDLARGLAQALDCELKLTVVESAGNSVEVLSNNQVDIGFVAVDPLRSETLAFTPPYVLIEGAYLIRDTSPITALEMVDSTGNRIVVGKGSAYDLHLTRTLRSASIVRVMTSPGVVDHFLTECCEVAAGVRQQLEYDAARHPGLRLLPGNFMQIAQAMAVPASRGEVVHAIVSSYIQTQKSCGAVSAALQAHRIDGATVAPV